MIQVWPALEQDVGVPAPAQDVVNVLGRVRPVRRTDSLSYRLNDGRRLPLPLGPTAFRLHRPGEFNIEIPTDHLKTGDNHLEIYQITRSGTEKRQALVLRYPGGTRWPLPYEAALTDLADATALSRTIQVVDGPWVPDRTGIRPAFPAYDRVFAVGDPGWRDVDITVEVRVVAVPRSKRVRRFPSGGSGIGIGAGWQGHTDWQDIRPRRGYLPAGTLLWLVTHPRRRFRNQPREEDFYLQSCSPEHPLERTANTSVQVAMRRWYRIRLAFTPDADPAYRAKFWRSDETEPERWMLEAASKPGETSTGSFVFVAHNVVAEFRNLRVVSLV